MNPAKSSVVVVVVLLTLRFYYYFTTPAYYKDGDQIRIAAKVISEPIRYETAQYLKLHGLKVYLPLYPEISYGDRVTIEGQVHDDKLTNPKLISLEPSKGMIYRFRQKLIGFYERSLPNPHSALVSGMVIGSKSGLPNDFWDSLKNSGTAHVVVASGMNVSLVGGFLLSFFIIFFKRKKALIIALVGVWTYAVLSGFDAPIVRSAIMGSIAFSAQEVGRLNLSLRALVLSGIVMLFVNPGYITDAGFLLSFFATLGIILFESKIRVRLSKTPDIIRYDLSTTLAAQIGVVPLLYYFFGQFNVLSPVINTLVLWTVVPITIIGMISGLVGTVVPMVGRAVLLLSYPLTWWFVAVVNFFG